MTDYNKINEETVKEETGTEEKTEARTGSVLGTVVGCKQLYVRKSPAVNDTNKLCIIPEGTMLEVIDPEKATKEWYKVELVDGTKGFCMKEFVSVED